MFRVRRQLLLKLWEFSDLCILITGVILSYLLLMIQRGVTEAPFDVSTINFLSARVKISHVIGVFAMAFLWHGLFRSFRLYHTRRLQNPVEEWKDIAKATSIFAVILFMAGNILKIDYITPFFLAVFWFVTTSVTIFFRTFVRYCLRKVRSRGRNLRLVLVVGTNERAQKFANLVRENRELGFLIIGYLDDVVHHSEKEIRLLGRLREFPRIIAERVVDEVVIALPVKSHYDTIQEIVEKAEEQGIIIRFLSDLFSTKSFMSRVDVIEGVPVLEMESRFQGSGRLLAKRAIDIFVGSTILVLLFPLAIVCAIAIKLTSSGPVFFVQDRVGYNKRVFRIYKFRTMVRDADKLQEALEAHNEMDGPVFKIRNDPRITPLGRWLRKTSLDELPQLINVIKGDMSLVGPRPLLVGGYRGFNQDWQRRRFSMRPGLTCLWQISGRNDTSFEDWMRLDMEYIDNWSLSGDMKIIFRTIPAILNGKGAW